jgi:transcription antitermination factor NusG
LTSNENNSFWYVVYTKPRWEKKIAQKLTQHSIENYCPLNKQLRQWSDRKKIILEPLFKGYIFIKIDEDKKWQINKIDGILNYVYWLGKPAKIRENDIETIKRFLEDFENIAIEYNSHTVGKNVIVTKGVFMNYKGIVLEVSGNNVKVLIDSMDIKLTATFDKNKLTAIN